MGTEYNDKWFVDNGYFDVHDEDGWSFVYTIYSKTIKFRKLFDTCLRDIDPTKQIITPEILYRHLNSENKRTARPRPRQYIKLSVEEIAKRKQLRQEKKKSK